MPNYESSTGQAAPQKGSLRKTFSEKKPAAKKLPENRRPRKRFGQNFLWDQNVIIKIMNAIQPQPDDHIVEIGPGRGALTGLLLDSGCQLDVIEIDRDLCAELGRKYPQLNIIEADILKFDLGKIIKNKPLRVVGNLPYNISTPLLFKLFDKIDDIQDMFFMLQLEVVNRLTAQHSTSEYGRLSVMSQYFCQSQKMFTVRPESFVPRPKVTSAIVCLRPDKSRDRQADVAVLGKILTEAFSKRRKTIRNALKRYINETEIRSLGLDPKARPENLTLQDYISVANFFTRRSSRPSQ